MKIDENFPINLKLIQTVIYICIHKKVMEKTTHLKMLYEKMVEEIQDYAIILLDVDGTILTWNKGVEKIKGYKAHEIIGQNFNIFYMPQDRQAMLSQKLLEHAHQEGRAKHIGRRVRKDGTTFWGSIIITAIHDEQNNVVGFTKLTRELRDNETD
jgi:PAS domain S-box-containing protein